MSNTAAPSETRDSATLARDDEPLILVDEQDHPTGTAGKIRVHREALLHRAFSIFVVDDRGRILLQQRSRKKYHSGGLWANSCCGHPRPDELTTDAAQRRLGEELGVNAPLTFGFNARYQGVLDNGMSENEYVHVFFGPLASKSAPNPDEIDDIAFVDVDELRQRMASDPEAYAIWLRHYFNRHFSEIAACVARARSNSRNQ